MSAQLVSPGLDSRALLLDSRRVQTMSEQSGRDGIPAHEADMFLEEVEASFDWRSIPVEGWICIPIFWVLAGVVFWQFFTRYALDNSAVWTEEVARQLLILLTFFGAAYALRTRAHICISYFVSRLGARGQRFVGEVSTLIQLAFYGYSFFLCLKIAKATQFQKLMSFDISKSVVYYAVAASFLIMWIRSAIEFYRLARAGWGGAGKHRVPSAQHSGGGGAP